MNLKSKVWKFATAFIVFFIILNPEMFQLALFIDAVGLDMLLMLFEIQIAAIFGLFFSGKIGLAAAGFKSFVKNRIPSISWKGIKALPGYMILAAPTQASLMHMLVISTLIDIAFNIHGRVII